MAATGQVSGIRRAFKRLTCASPGRDRWQQPERVVRALGIGPGDRAADLGAGSGYFTFRLAEAVGPTGRVYAVDTDPATAALVADRAAREGVPQVVPVTAGSEEPGLPEPVDVVLIVDAFHHLPDPRTYLAAVAGQLRPGGRLAVIEPVPRWFRFGHATDPAEVAAVLREAGYTRAAEHRFLPHQSFQIFAPAAS